MTFRMFQPVIRGSDPDSLQVLLSDDVLGSSPVELFCSASELADKLKRTDEALFAIWNTQKER